MSIGNLFGTGGESNSLYGTSLESGGTIPPSSFIYFEWFIFKTSTGQPATPTGGSWDFLTNTGTPPTGWLSTVNGVPANNLWFSVAFVDSRNPTNIVWSTTSLISAATSVYATAYADTFTGTGSTTSWTLSADPVVVNNLDVSINGVTQTPTVDYTISGTTFTTTTAAPLGSIILVKYRQALPNSYFGTANNVGFTPYSWISATNVQAALNEVADDISATDGVSGSNLVGYKPVGTGAVATTVQAKLRQTVSVFDFMTSAQIADVQAGTYTLDTSAAIQSAINSGATCVTFPSGSYRMNSGITITSSTPVRDVVGLGLVTLKLYTAVQSSIFEIQPSKQFLYFKNFVLTSNGTAGDGLQTYGILSISNAYTKFDDIRASNFSGAGLELRQCVYSGISNYTASSCFYGLSFQKYSGVQCTAVKVDRAYISGCTRGVTQNGAVDMIYHGLVMEYCGSTITLDGALHLSGGTAIFDFPYFEANYRNIVASDAQVTMRNIYGDATGTAADSITYSGTAFNERGWDVSFGYKHTMARLDADSYTGRDLVIGTNLTVPLAGGSVVFGNETMAVANGTLTSATWTTVYTIPTAENTGYVNERALYEYTCYAGAADLGTGFDSGTIMNGTLRSYSGTTPAWLRLSGNTVQMNVTGTSYGLLYKIVMRRVYPS